MNTLNAVVFVMIGAAMEILPSAAPSLFPRTCADCASTGALWTAFMGATQLGMGMAYLVRAHAFPVVARLLAAWPADGREAGALAAARGLAGR